MDSTPNQAILVVPCYNEEKRLNTEQFVQCCQQNPDIQWLFVNDGSQDKTLEVLEEMKSQNPKQIHVLALEKNQGKGEAVRQGMLKATEFGASLTGYFDADLATPINEILRLKSVLAEKKPQVLLGSRVFLLGHRIERKKWRYLLGRAFANVASFFLKLNIHDTQCGAKFFINFPLFRECLSKPFQSRWLFDVELISRLLTTGQLDKSDFYEEPLLEWTDVAGSKLKVRHFLMAVWDLFKLRLQMR